MQDTPAPHTLRSDTLVLAMLNASGYAWAFWAAGGQTPNDGTYLCLVGGVISLVPAPREICSSAVRRAAILGLIVSGIVIWHIVMSPCIGPCK